MDWERFIAAQDAVWPAPIRELRAGRKRSHWMWFVFPQLGALGRSDTAKYYGLDGLEDARAYLAHPELRDRLIEAVEAATAAPTVDAEALMGGIDAVKLRSSLTLFEAAADDAAPFRKALDRFYGGERCARTLELLGE